MCDGDTAGLSVVQRACGQCRGRGRLAGTRPATRPQPLDQLRRSATNLLTLPTGSTTTRALTRSCKDRGSAPSSNPSNRNTTSTTSPTSSPVWKARLETALNHAATILTPGEFFTPGSIVRTLVALLEPERGTVYDPCCGSGGMFVQSDAFTRHSGRLSFYGQESKDFTWRLCKMNLFIHGIDGNIKLGDTYFADHHAALKADYIIANPPFNDGSKGQQGWGAGRVPDKDPRRTLPNGEKAPLAARNANTMWILHFLHHLAEGGTAGFVMATGELSNSELARLEVRTALVAGDHVDCIVQLPGQLFANTQIPCALWFLSKGRDGRTGQRRRLGEVLFIDARKLGALVPGSRKQKQLAPEEIDRIAEVYRTFKRTGRPEEVSGFCKVATLAEIAEHRYALTPGRYVGATAEDDEELPFDERFPALTERLKEQFRRSAELQACVTSALAEVNLD